MISEEDLKKESLDDVSPKTIIVNRMNLNFDDDSPSLLINMTDISAYIGLKKQQEINTLLKTLNASVHHEMIVPLQVNVDMAKRLKKSLKKFPSEKRLAENIIISSQLVLLHSHDFLDKQLIEKG